MIHKTFVILTLVIGHMLASCTNSSNSQTQTEGATIQQTDLGYSADTAEVVYTSERLIISRISDHVYGHTSFLHTRLFGNVPCNGIFVVNGNEAVVFDTPTNNHNSEELIGYITKDLDCKVKAVVATHFHIDCLGGLEVFHSQAIPSYASNQTIELAKNSQYNEPQNGFYDQISLEIGDKKVLVEYFGEGHTKDNVIGYFPHDQVLFGGCLIKEVGAGKGNLEDANTSVWSETVSKIKSKYPAIKIVVPGHGELGGVELFDYTIGLFE